MFLWEDPVLVLQKKTFLFIDLFIPTLYMHFLT